MPKLVTQRATYRMARRGFRDAKELAASTGLPHSRVRNGVYGHDPLNMVDIFALAKALREDNETVEAVVDDLVDATGDGVPEEPPKQPKGPTGPARRQDTEEKKTGPKRAKDQVGAA